MKGKGNSDGESSYEDVDLKRSKVEQTRTEGRQSPGSTGSLASDRKELKD